MRISPHGGKKKKVQTYNWNGEAAIRLYQRLAATFDGERGTASCKRMMRTASFVHIRVGQLRKRSDY